MDSAAPNLLKTHNWIFETNRLFSYRSVILNAHYFESRIRYDGKETLYNVEQLNSQQHHKTTGTIHYISLTKGDFNYPRNGEY